MRSPPHLLNGTITSNGLHFVRLHSGVPDIDPDKHKLPIHGRVERPLVFALDAAANIKKCPITTTLSSTS
jgi:sulfane dehydrogenase subunit SoxC